MPKIKELPFYGSYGFTGDTQFRYFFLHEDSENVTAYKEAIIKCLKYDILYNLLPDHSSGHDTYDSLRPPVTLPVQLSSNKFAKVFHESVRGTQSGEIVVTYTFSEDRKSIELTLYDRDTILQPVQKGDEDGPLEYAIVDRIIESKVTVRKGKKITPQDIKIYSKPEKYIRSDPHSYEDSIKVIEAVKSKLDYKLDDPRNHLVEEPEKKKTDTQLK
jgi:hypothetical protein